GQSRIQYKHAYGWVLFTLLIPYSHSGGKPLLSALSSLVFIIFCFCVVRPILPPFIERKTDSYSWDRPQFMGVLMGTFVCAFITDFLGTHHIVGAFIYGLILPHGRFAELVMEMTDDFVTGVLCPIYFAGFGLKINYLMIVTQPKWHLMLLIMLLLSIPKVLSSLITTFFFGMSARDGIGIGLLLNTKGIMALILLSVAWDRKILNLYDFTIMMLGIIIMTVLVSPLINATYKPKFRFKQSQLRTVQKLRSDVVLRVVACVHNACQATAMTHVLETVNATRISPLHVFALHLVELTRYGTALLVAQMEHSNSNAHGGEQKLSESQAEFESITNTFDEFVEGYNAVRFETSSVVSTYETIHEDIYNVAEEKFASLIILPFHKELNSEGVLETTHTAQSDINKSVLQQSPCSVVIFVDRGLGSLLQTSLRIVVIFIGGPDDREALSIAWRMAGHSGIQLDVVRVLLLGEAKEEEEEENTMNNDANELLCTVRDNGVQKQMDDEYIFSFRHKAMNNNESIVYSEEEVHTATGEEIPLLLNELDKNDYDLYIVGQSCGRNSRVFSKLLEWCDNPELGVIGDIVASTSFGTRASLLVVQQYDSGSKRKTQHQKKCHQKNDGPEMML
ncbi:cation/H(+) antiporter 15-like, partial [Gastrolobium bilobum]|uniref:cation/H(+) antiporter 15-like n=1 Tax=Gastrolobium bilobum TaxID=150636 RepID=UPI002AAFAAEF